MDGSGEEIDWPCKRFGEEEMWGRSDGSSAKRSSRVSQIVKVNLASHRRREGKRERERERDRERAEYEYVSEVAAEEEKRREQRKSKKTQKVNRKNHLWPLVMGVTECMASLLKTTTVPGLATMDWSILPCRFGMAMSLNAGQEGLKEGRRRAEVIRTIDVGQMACGFERVERKRHSWVWHEDVPKWRFLENRKAAHLVIIMKIKDASLKFGLSLIEIQHNRIVSLCQIWPIALITLKEVAATISTFNHI